MSKKNLIAQFVQQITELIYFLFSHSFSQIFPGIYLFIQLFEHFKTSIGNDQIHLPSVVGINESGNQLHFNQFVQQSGKVSPLVQQNLFNFSRRNTIRMFSAKDAQNIEMLIIQPIRFQNLLGLI